MRVIAGTAKGRGLKAVPGVGTRPTTDKVKEAIFSMIGPFFDGGLAVDLFAGTGGLGIEALSRGIDRVIFVDLESKSIEVIKQNLTTTGFELNAEIYRNDAGRAVKALAKRAVKLDLLFLDPPYRMKDADRFIEEMDKHKLFNSRAVIVLEYDSSHHYPQRIANFECAKQAVYGDIAVSIYRMAEPVEEQTHATE